MTALASWAEREPTSITTPTAATSLQMRMRIECRSNFHAMLPHTPGGRVPNSCLTARVSGYDVGFLGEVRCGVPAVTSLAKSGS